MLDEHLALPIGRRLSLLGHFDVPVILEHARPLVSTTASEQSALGKLLANGSALIEVSALPWYEQGGL